MSFYDPKLTEDYCKERNASGACIDVPAAKGTRLPVTAKFKGNLTGRYTWDVGESEWYAQASAVHEGKRSTDLRIMENGIKGDLPGYSTLDLSAGLRWQNWTVDMYIKNATDARIVQGRFTQCAENVCGARGFDAKYPKGQVYETIGQPRTIGIRAGWNF